MTDPRPLVIYHSPCQDGFAAAVAAYSQLGDGAEYLGAAHGDGLADRVVELGRGRRVYVLDFSFPKAVMEALEDAASALAWLDHHKTAFEDWLGEWRPGAQHLCLLKNGGTILLDDGRSGAMLAWWYFCGKDAPPMGIRHIDDRDRWKFKLEGTREYCARLAMVPYDMQRWLDNFRAQEREEMVSISYDKTERRKVTTHVYDAWIETGRLLVRRHEMDVEAAREHARHFSLRTDDATFAGLIVNAPRHLASELGHALAETSGTFGLVWYLSAHNTARCSLRSTGDYDVSVLARLLGGGGHRNAAGFEVPLAELTSWLVG